MEHLVVESRSHVAYRTQFWALYFIALFVSGIAHWPQSEYYVASVRALGLQNQATITGLVNI